MSFRSQTSMYIACCVTASSTVFGILVFTHGVSTVFSVMLGLTRYSPCILCLACYIHLWSALAPCLVCDIRSRVWHISPWFWRSDSFYIIYILGISMCFSSFVSNSNDWLLEDRVRDEPQERISPDGKTNRCTSMGAWAYRAYCCFSSSVTVASRRFIKLERPRGFRCRGSCILIVKTIVHSCWIKSGIWPFYDGTGQNISTTFLFI